MKQIKLSDHIIQTFRVLKVVYGSSKKYFFSFVLQGLLKSIQPYITIYYSYLIIDGIIGDVGKNALYALVTWMIILNFIVAVMLNITRYFVNAYMYQLNYQLTHKIALKSFMIDYSQIEDNEVQSMLQKAKEGSNGNGGLPSYCEHILVGILSSTLSIVYGVVLMSKMLDRTSVETSSKVVQFFVSPISMIIILVALVIPTIVSIIVMKKDNKRSYEAMSNNNEANRRFGYFFQICSNYKFGKDFRLFNMKKMLMATMNDDKYSVESVWRNYTRKNNIGMSIIIMSNKILALVSYMYVGINAIYGAITVGSVVSYVATITLVSQSITNLVHMITKLQLSNSYLKNYFDYLNLPSSMEYGNKTIKHVKSVRITFQNVSFKYPNQEEYCLKNVSFTMEPGQNTAIVGENGAGKTTIVKLLCRFYEPTQGSILINDINIKELSKKSLQRLFGVVFQDFKLFSYSIRHNVMASENGNESRVRKSLIESGFAQKLQELPNDIDTILYQRNKESGIDVSGGEAQKIAIARALYKDAPIVILDEPTAALDPESEAEIYERFEDIVKNKTSIFISHRMSSCKFCDRIIVLSNGKVVEHGNHYDLIKQSHGYYKKLWDAQAKYYKSSTNI